MYIDLIYVLDDGHVVRYEVIGECRCLIRFPVSGACALFTRQRS